MTSHPSIAGYDAVFRHFGATATSDRSEIRSAPVFRATLAGGRRVVLKRTATRTFAGIVRWTTGLAARGIPVVTPVPLGVDNPVVIGDRVWVAYPWVDGRQYQPTETDIAAAGTLLGRIHAAGIADSAAAPMHPFDWPQYDDGEIAADLDLVGKVLQTRSGIDDAGPLVDNLTAVGTRFEAELLPAIRDAGLPIVAATVDYKANNLVYTATGPVLIDPDNGERLPRLLDLALAALLFHTEQPTAPGAPFDPPHWQAFVTAYLEHVTLTAAERRLWPDALDYMLWEWGSWVIADADDDDWAQPRQRDFLLALAATTRADFPLR